MTRKGCFPLFLAFFISLSPLFSLSLPLSAATPPVGRVLSITGSVLADRPIKGEKGLTLRPNDHLFEGDLIKTVSRSTTELLIHDSLVTLSENSEFSITSASLPKRPIFELIKGRIRAMICKVLGDKEILLTTPNAVIGMRGTMVDVAYSGEVTWVCPLSDGDPSLLHFSKSALEMQKHCEVLEELRRTLGTPRAAAARHAELTQQIERCWKKFDKLSQIGANLIRKAEQQQISLKVAASTVELSTRTSAEAALRQEIPSAQEIARWRETLSDSDQNIAHHQESVASLGKKIRETEREFAQKKSPLLRRYQNLLSAARRHLQSLREKSLFSYSPNADFLEQRLALWHSARATLGPLSREIDELSQAYESELTLLEKDLLAHEESLGKIALEREEALSQLSSTQNMTALLQLPPEQYGAQPVTSLAHYLVKGVGAQAALIPTDQADRAIASSGNPSLEQARITCEESRRRFADLKNALECMTVFRAKMKAKQTSGELPPDWEKKCASEEFSEHPERRPAECSFLEAARDCSSLESFAAIVEASGGPGASSLFPSSGPATIGDSPVSTPAPGLTESTTGLTPFLSPDTNIALQSLAAQAPPEEPFASESTPLSGGENFIESLVPTPACF